jgi:DNA-binding HxlR family transcriptional regulator
MNLQEQEMGRQEETKRGYSKHCPQFHRAVELVGRRWMGTILFVLMKGPHRFNEILAAIPGLSDRLLTERLRELEANGVVVRRVFTGSPIRVEYELTEAGQDLRPSLEAIREWSHKWLPAY